SRLHLSSPTLFPILLYTLSSLFLFFFFFFNDPSTPEIYTLSLHDALPISGFFRGVTEVAIMRLMDITLTLPSLLLAIVIVAILGDRKSTRLNSSHLVISYAVFCLKKKKKNI